MDLRVQEELPHPVDRVWRVVSNFSDLSWNAPMVEKVTVQGEGIGMLRHVHMVSAPAPLVQRLEAMDDENRCFSFRIIDGMQVELSDYKTWVQVKELSDDRSLIDISLHFDEPRGAELEELRFLFENAVRSSLGRLNYYLDHHIANP